MGCTQILKEDIIWVSKVNVLQIPYNPIVKTFCKLYQETLSAFKHQLLMKPWTNVYRRFGVNFELWALRGADSGP